LSRTLKKTNPTKAPTAADGKAPDSVAAQTVAERHFFGEPLVGLNPAGLSGSLIVVEGVDGSGRSTQITLLQEWLESEGFAVQTTGLRRSNLVGRNIDDLLAKNAVTRLTLALMYATDFFDQLEHRIIPALRSGLGVLADR
jgi:dTMP kinase